MVGHGGMGLGMGEKIDFSERLRFADVRLFGICILVPH